MDPPSVPSAFCSLYSNSILLKLSENCSVGWMSDPPDPLSEYEDTIESCSVIFKYSCWSLPALRATRTAVLIGSPEQQRWNNLGPALSTCFVKTRSSTCTLPDPMPPPDAAEPRLVAFADHDMRSISFLCLSSWLSPWIPSSLRK